MQRIKRNDYYTPLEAAEAIGCDRRTIYRYLESGKLTRFNPVPGSTVILIPRTEVNALTRHNR